MERLFVERKGFSVKECVLYDRECCNCGECLRCDLNPEKICDNCAAEKPQRKEAEDTITLFDFLNGLSDEQQKAAFAHLKLKWERVQGSGLYGRS